ncbi:MAG: outer membrane lipoprotein-sorting protein [Candidatus Omnitrophota bacterium]
MNKSIIYTIIFILTIAGILLLVLFKTPEFLEPEEPGLPTEAIEETGEEKPDVMDQQETPAPAEVKKPVITITGQELAEKVYNRDDGDSAHSITEMVLRDKNGHERKRIMEMYTKDFDPLVRAFIEFTDPADIRGTRFLSWENADEDDTQYLYLPELGRARRIVSNQKKLRFVNTDFSYEDMERRKPDEDKHEISGEAVYLQRPVFILESEPFPDTSQYGRRETFVDQESLIPVSIDFYDKKGELIKEFRVHELKEIDGIWTAMSAEMRDLEAGHKTFMNLKEVEYNIDLSEQYFELRNLEQ